MKHLKITILISFSITLFQSFAQNVQSKDGVSLGSRKDFINNCIKGANSSLLEVNGIKVNTEKYCSCMCDNLIPNLESDEILTAIANDSFEDLIMEENNLEVVLNCFEEGNLKLSDESIVNETKNENLFVSVGVKTCIEKLINDETTKEYFTEQIAEEYCNCAITKLFAEGFNISNLSDLENENSESFNEIILPCLTDAFANIPEFQTSNSYVKQDIEGGDSKSEVPLIDYLGQGYKIKISIAGVSKYYLFDTGATDLMIDSDTEKQLQKLGALKKENYLHKSEYQMANNEIVTAQMVQIDHVKIGDYTVNNVVLAVLKNGSLLCGQSFLDKFQNWEIDKKNKILILYK